MVPDHYFLAFAESSDEDAELIGLETTMLGNAKLRPSKELPDMLEKAKSKEFKASLETFHSALDAANDSLAGHADAFEDAGDPGTQLISVDDPRELGITPIASDFRLKP